MQAAFRRRGWDRSAGSSGTVRAIGEAIRELDNQALLITPAGLERIMAYVLEAGHVRELKLAALTEDRRPVFPGGLAILAEIFAGLSLKEMRIAEGAMREGLLYDMVGRYTDEDARDRTVRGMQQRYHVDFAQAERVEATALQFPGAGPGHLEAHGDPAADLALKWAARLHEIGLDVSHSGYQRHGAVSARERRHAGVLARGAAAAGAHGRRSSPQAGARGHGGAGAALGPQRASISSCILRLAVLLHRGRSSAALPPIALTPGSKSLELRFPARWLNDHPLTLADLQQEVDYLRAAGIRLRVFSRASIAIHGLVRRTHC